jgi:hypothetical protein
MQEILINCKPNSALIFFFGNETYDVPQTMWLNLYAEKIRFAYIYNFPRRSPFYIAFRCLIGAIYDGGFKNWQKDRNILRNFKNGIDLMRRTRKIRMLFNYSDFPQGYTNRFVKELITEGYFTGEGSLIDGSPVGQIQGKKGISFTGQPGSWCRSLAISVLKQYDQNFNPTYTHGWGGSNQGIKTTYVKSLANSKFALNPPGNLTNRTFRYLESLILGSLPIMPPSTLQDPHLWGIWSEFQKPKKFSWKNQLKYSSKLDDNQIIGLIDQALLEEKRKIESINKNLDQIFLSFELNE